MEKRREFRPVAESKRDTIFSQIREVEDMVSYLDGNLKSEKGTSRTIKGNYYVSQYTNIYALIGILNSKRWYFSNPKNMNDRLEYDSFEQKDWEDIFFGSFMYDQGESISMWSMYGQPWDLGIQISFPVSYLKGWIKGIQVIYEADPKSKQPIENRYVTSKEATVKLTSVVYTHYNEKNVVDPNYHSCGTSINMNTIDMNDPKLIGYVKNHAWNYEKEIRLRIELPADKKYQAIMVDVPDELTRHMVLTTGPRFQEDVKEFLRKNLKDPSILEYIKIEESMFADKLSWVYCDSCKWKKNK